MRKVTYYRDMQMKEPFTIEYDENALCRSCGEPVISASMGGTIICPSCDLGKCRYCKTRIDMLYDKEERLEHMKWHHEKTPEIVKNTNDVHRRMNEIFDRERAEARTQASAEVAYPDTHLIQ